MELRIQKEWNADLNDGNSKTYKEFSLILEKEVRYGTSLPFVNYRSRTRFHIIHFDFDEVFMYIC